MNRFVRLPCSDSWVRADQILAVSVEPTPNEDGRLVVRLAWGHTYSTTYPGQVHLARHARDLLIAEVNSILPCGGPGGGAAS